MKWFFLFLRLLLGGVFLFAGVIKASSSESLILTISVFTALPHAWLRPLAMALPWVEIAAGIMIIFGPRKWGAALIFLLCLLFCGVIGWALANGIIVACSCFGDDESPSAGKMELAVARDIGLALAAAAVFFESFLRRLIAHRHSAAR